MSDIDKTYADAVADFHDRLKEPVVHPDVINLLTADYLNHLCTEAVAKIGNAGKQLTQAFAVTVVFMGCGCGVDG